MLIDDELLDLGVAEQARVVVATGEAGVRESAVIFTKSAVANTSTVMLFE